MEWKQVKLSDGNFYYITTETYNKLVEIPLNQPRLVRLSDVYWPIGMGHAKLLEGEIPINLSQIVGIFPVLYDIVIEE